MLERKRPTVKRIIKPPYKICEHCGAHLDVGERCDCQKGTNTAPNQKEEA